MALGEDLTKGASPTGGWGWAGTGTVQTTGQNVAELWALSPLEDPAVGGRLPSYKGSLWVLPWREREGLQRVLCSVPAEIHEVA